MNPKAAPEREVAWRFRILSDRLAPDEIPSASRLVVRAAPFLPGQTCAMCGDPVPAGRYRCPPCVEALRRALEYLDAQLVAIRSAPTTTQESQIEDFAL